MIEPGDRTVPAGRVLVVDDDAVQVETLRGVLRRAGYDVQAANGAEGALREFDAGKLPDLVVTDLRMAGADGLDLLRALKQRDPLVEVIVLTAYGSVEKAVEAVRAGAYDFLLKPIERTSLLAVVGKALERRALVVENRSLRRALQARPEGHPVALGCSRPFRSVLDLVDRVAPSDASVLLCGESGTGKSLVARMLHERSARSAGPFVTVFCAALPEALLEAELFGHERGAFTGAVSQRKGRVEQAHGGTLFLDEVGEIPLALQVKLLRLLEDHEFERVGGEETLRSDFRLVAATNADLRRGVEERRFREDLYYRLKVIEVEVPPLRVRTEDVAVLAAHFVRLHAANCGKPVRDLAPEALDLLQRHPWPGNVRELDHVLERAVVLTRNSRIEAEDLPPSIVQGEVRVPLEEGKDPFDTLVGRPLKEVEDAFIEKTVLRCGGSVRQAARALGISERTIFRHRRRGVR